MADRKSKLIKGSDKIIPIVEAGAQVEGVMSASGFTKRQETFIRSLIAQNRPIFTTVTSSSITAVDGDNRITWTGGSSGAFTRTNYDLTEYYPSDKYSSYELIPIYRNSGGYLFFNNAEMSGYVFSFFSCRVTNNSGGKTMKLVVKLYNKSGTLIETYSGENYVTGTRPCTLICTHGCIPAERGAYYEVYVSGCTAGDVIDECIGNIILTNRPHNLYDNLYTE